MTDSPLYKDDFDRSSRTIDISKVVFFSPSCEGTRFGFALCTLERDLWFMAPSLDEKQAWLQASSSEVLATNLGSPC